MSQQTNHGFVYMIYSYMNVFILFVCDLALIELAFPLAFLLFHWENSLLDERFGMRTRTKSTVLTRLGLLSRKMVSTTVNWQQQQLLPTRNPSSASHTKPAKRPGQARPASQFNSFFIRLHSLGILYAYGYIFGGATLFRAAANATAHWR